MADFPLTENPEFNSTMRKLETADLAHADTFNPGYQTLLDNDNYLKMEADKIKSSRQVTLPADRWDAEAPYTQTVPVEGMTETDSPLPYLVDNGDTEPVSKAIKKAYSCISFFESGAGLMTVTCKYKKPVIDITIGLKGV